MRNANNCIEDNHQLRKEKRILHFAARSGKAI